MLETTPNFVIQTPHEVELILSILYVKNISLKAVFEHT